MFYGQKSACVTLTEYEMLAYEQACNSVAAFCKLQTAKIEKEINETVNTAQTET
jgi:hypothetical protein